MPGGGTGKEKQLVPKICERVSPQRIGKSEQLRAIADYNSYADLVSSSRPQVQKCKFHC